MFLRSPGPRRNCRDLLRCPSIQNDPRLYLISVGKESIISHLLSAFISSRSPWNFSRQITDQMLLMWLPLPLDELGTWDTNRRYSLIGATAVKSNQSSHALSTPILINQSKYMYHFVNKVKIRSFITFSDLTFQLLYGCSKDLFTVYVIAFWRFSVLAVSSLGRHH